MKYVYGILISIFCYTGAFSQAAPQVTPYLQIQLYVSQLIGECNFAALKQTDTVYVHSGLQWKTTTSASLDSIWQSIVGIWGVDSSPGNMTRIGTTNDTFSICFNIVDYYSTLADPPGLNEGSSAGIGPMNPDSTPFNIGMVFRIGTCPLLDSHGKPECNNDQEGKDENCDDIYILGLQSPNSDSTLNVYDDGLQTFTAVAAQYVQGCPAGSVGAGIKSLNNSVTSLSVYPSPFTTVTRIDFDVAIQSKPKLTISNVLGQQVADLSSSVTTGHNSINWNGTDMSGVTVPSGVYMVQINTGDRIYSTQIVKQ